MAVWNAPARLWKLIRDLEDALSVLEKLKSAFGTLDVRLRALEDRMTHLEAGQPQVIIEARAAAGAAATGLAGSVIADVVTRVTRVEMRQDDLHRRLPPPA